MDNNEELIRKADIQQLADEGNKVYQEVKHQYEPHQNGSFLAIEVESKRTYLGNTASEAVELARAAHSEKVFYVIKIGSSASEVLAGLEAEA